MNIVTEHITIQNEVLILTNQRAIYWERENALILSDLHIGKTAHFRKHGIPMPDAILQRDLGRLKQLIHNFKAKTLLVVGDLFHAEANVDMQTFKDWLLGFDAIKVVLIKGNHDRQSKALLEDLHIETVAQLNLHPFVFIHEPTNKILTDFTISGHTHPGVLIKGTGKQKLKLPCYQVTEKQLVLPAFSLFTGLNTRDVPEGAICYAFTDASFFKF